MIDLHMHTTASDGRLSPAELVVRVATAGLKTISVTDHDTVAAIAETTTLAAAAGIRVVPGIEITAVEDNRDVHVLGYFFDPASERLAEFLVSQRDRRVMRVREIAERLAAANILIDVDRLLKTAAERPGSSVGRPQIAREMVRAGHVPSVQAAFELWLAAGRPAFVPRIGPNAATVIETIHGAGGLASFAHPGVTKRDDLIAPLADRGLDAIEVYHSDHTQEDTTAYRRLAARLGLLVSGGSDFHGDDPSKPERVRRAIFGAIGLPPTDFLALEQRSRV
ncbi:MAG TPA: PHP domain-containing protein, partial [Vicinamibacterales bacterium]|nr:PHP domain-containing protein [Vicinamibacterales bacterium]